MARRRKHRTHQKGANAAGSFVVKHGQVGTSLAQLPNTATRLKVKNEISFKDFFAMAPALKVTHLLALTLTDLAPSLRLVRLPVGPTFSFRVERYSLMKDVRKISRSAPSQGLEYLTAPLLVLASFPPPFQSMFPPLSPKSMSLSGARRIVLIAYNAERGTVKPYGVSKRVRRVLEGTSQKSSRTFYSEKEVNAGPESEAGLRVCCSPLRRALRGDDGDAVSLSGLTTVGRNNRRGQKKAVKLNEVGPRLELRLVKITEGVPGKDGEVLYHEFGTWPHIETRVGQRQLRSERRSEKKSKRKMSDAKKKRQADRQQDSGSTREDPENSANESDEEQSEGEWDEEEEVSDDEDGEGETDAESESDRFEERPAKKSKTRIKP
ncbi:Brix domain-containing protein [Pisolithus croceorrhizus]|nr:Brix domain-containing protein [Pisolithus croceorrhizus]